MPLDELDIDWDYLLERLEHLLDLGEEYLARKLEIYQPDPEIFSRHSALRWLSDEEGGLFAPVQNPDLPARSDLVGIDAILDCLTQNTRQFAAGYPANNVLLWGERGCGKSSAVKSMLREFSDTPLRMIEVRKEDLFSLPDITFFLSPLPYRFILFCDDLAFADNDVDFRELKALLEGSTEARPENVLVYATSNRRHLMPERMEENTGEAEIHPEDAVAEKLSLSDRFGLTFGFYPMREETYLAIARHLATLRDLEIEAGQLDEEARQWAHRRGGRSGRVARQFIDDLTGRLATGAHPGLPGA